MGELLFGAVDARPLHACLMHTSSAWQLSKQISSFVSGASCVLRQACVTPFLLVRVRITAVEGRPGKLLVLLILVLRSNLLMVIITTTMSC